MLAPREEGVCEDTELLLVFAARMQHVERVIKPALARGDWVISDRFTDATIAYQGAGRRMGVERIQALRRLLLGDFAPDLTLLLDVPVDSGMQRLAGRGAPDRFEMEGREFFDRVRAAYLQLAAAEPARFRVIDAAGPLPDVQAAVAQALEGFLAQDATP